MGSNGEDPVTQVRGADGSRRYAIPLDIEPQRGQVPKNLSPEGSAVESKEIRHVLQQDVAGSKLANGSGHLAPQNGLGMAEPGLEPGRTGPFAGEPSGDEVDGLGGDPTNSSNVGENRTPWEPPLEHAPSPRVGLTTPAQVSQPGEVQADVELSGAGEQGAMGHPVSL